MEIFEDRLPPRPYCKDRVSDRRIIAEKAEAIKYKHIQPNSPFKVSWLVFDIDRETAGQEPLFIEHTPMPNITATNPENGHAHYFYGLEREVLMDKVKTKTGDKVNPRIRKHPVRYLAVVEQGMTYLLQADPAYNDKLSKNPLHNYWKVDIWRDYLYDLNELADYIDLELAKENLKAAKDARKNLPAIGYGRNCILFEKTLKFAIKEFRKGGWLNNQMYWQAVEYYALCQNKILFNNYIHGANFGPLGYREVLNIVKSATAWIAQNHTKEGFYDRQSAVGKLAKNQKQAGIASGLIRLNMAIERNAEIIEYKQLYPNIPNRELADMWGVSKSTVDHLRTENGLSLNDIVNIGSENIIGVIP